MSKVFYDHLVSLDDVEKALKKRKLSVEEREELWKIIDEMVHHRVVGCILEHLPSEHHGDFVKRFTDKPHDDAHWDYLRERVGTDLQDFIKQELRVLADELHGIVSKRLS
jgi:hypothetical protein